MPFSSIDKGSSYFNTKLYTGTGATQSITGVGFQPDWVWFKDRTNAYGHDLYDSIRGATYRLQTNDVGQESLTTTGLTSFDSDGFSMGSFAGQNSNGANYVSWNWKANGAGSSNTQGTITSTVSANTTSGFSVVKYTGNGTSGANFGHGLGVKPACVIVKSRSLNTQNWQFVSKALSATPFASGNYLKLNSTDAMGTNTAVWNAEPTSSLIYLTSSADTNSSGATYVCYAFAEIKGFSKFGSFSGNGNADGTFVYTGFTPAFIITKLTSGTGSWFLHDNKRNGYNGANNYVYPNASDAELTTQLLDIVSNGFKMRFAGGANSSGTSIYMAFASNPFVTSKGLPVTAR